MRVAFYAPLKPPNASTPSGDRRMARLLIRAIRRAGHEPVVVSRFRSYEGAGDADAQDRIRRRGERVAERLEARLTGPLRPDLWFTYHLYYKAPDWLGPRVAGRLGIPYVAAEASYAPKRAKGAWDAGHRAVEGAIRAADHVFALSPEDRECVAPLLKAGAGESLLPPFLDAGPYRRARVRRAEARRRLADRHGIDAGLPWLLAVGMMRPGDKLASYRLLAEALAECRDRAWRLLIAGGGPAEKAVFELFAPLRDRVVPLGVLDEKALVPVYGACDLFVWPAVREAFGMAILEAQAAGLPVVAGHTGGVAGIVADGETGLVTAPGDSGAFAAATRRLLENGDLRASMGTAARDRVASDHDLALAAARLDTVFRKLDPRSR